MMVGCGAILRSDLAVFDTSGGNPNVAFEFGLAVAQNKQAIPRSGSLSRWGTGGPRAGPRCQAGRRPAHGAARLVGRGQSSCSTAWTGAISGWADIAVASGHSTAEVMTPATSPLRPEPAEPRRPVRRHQRRRAAGDLRAR